MSDNNLLAGGDDTNHNDLPMQKSDTETMHSENLPSLSLHRDDRDEISGEISASVLVETSDQFTPRINVYENIPFAGGDGDYSILSVLFGPHSIGEGIFSFMTMIDSNKVRVQCRECHQAVKDFPWMDSETKIKGSVKAWRAAFPVARAVNVSERDDIVDEDFVHIRGDARARLHTVKIARCKNVTDAAFIYLRGIHTLFISGCNQATITDAAFIHLRGIHTLDMSCCNQATITDAAFINLRGIQELFMIRCNQETITDAAFVHLQGIQLLSMNNCNQATITDAAFVHLRGIRGLSINGCNQVTIADVAFVHLRGIGLLCMNYCNQVTITDAAFVHLHGIRKLEMKGCNQVTISDAAFVHLRGIRNLKMDGCIQPTITDAALVNLVGIKALNTKRCSRDVRIAAAQVMGIDYESEPDEDENEDNDEDEDEDEDE